MDTAPGTAPVIEDTATDHAQDTAAITQVIADIETAFNTNDPELMTRHFARNGAAVNAVGVRISGREALLDANTKALAGFLRDQYVRYEVSGITFVRPDVAIAAKEARAADADGTPIDTDPAMVAQYVLVKEHGTWWIAARQNTLTPS